MSLRCSAVILLWASSHTLADVVTYEATVTPDQAGWEIIQLYCDPDVWIQEGWLFEDLQMCEGIEPPEGQTAVYRRSFADFIGVDTFFVEWVVETTADRSEIPVGGGANISAWSNGGVN